MNKTLATILYVAAATVVNIAVMLVMLFLLASLAGLFLTTETDERVRLLVFIGIVSLSVVSAYLVYQRLVAWLEAKYGLSRYLKGSNGLGKGRKK